MRYLIAVVALAGVACSGTVTTKVPGNTTDTTAPTVTLSASKSTAAPNDTFILTAVAMDDVAVASVEFFTVAAGATGENDADLTSIGVATTAPYVQTVTLTNAATGLHRYAAKATDTSGNVSTVATADVTVTPGVVPTTVTLSATETSVTSDGSDTLTATVTGSATISKVEFFEGATKLGEDTTAPYTQVVAFTSADNGTHSYTARSTDTASAQVTSSPLVVTVAIGADWYVDPNNGDDGNNGRTTTTAFKTICKAQTVVTDGQIIGLLDGFYDVSCAPSFTQKVTIKSVNPGQAIVQARIALAADSTITSLMFDSIDSVHIGGVDATGGTVNIDDASLRYVGADTTGPVLSVFTAKNAGTIMNINGSATNMATQQPFDGSGISLASALLGATVNVSNITYDDSVSGNPDPFCAPLFNVGSNSHITISGSSIQHKGETVNAITGAGVVISQSTFVNLSTHPGTHACNNILDANASASLAITGLTAHDGLLGFIATEVGTLTIDNSTIGPFSTACFDILADTPPTVTATIGTSTFQGCTVGIAVDGNQAVIGHTLTFTSGTGISITGTSAGYVFDNSSFVGTTVTGIDLESAGGAGATVDAHGGTWQASVQGAAADGTYTGAVTENGPANGTNFVLGTAADVLILATP
jgi:hypothetical protein